jgi:ankyrin repeat protein
MKKINKKELFIQSMRKGNQELFLSILPHTSISQKSAFRILRKNMKFQHDFITKALFKKKYIRNPLYIKELLFYGIRLNYQLGVKRALQLGADPNDLFREKHSLTYACRHASKTIIKMLLDKGANPNPTNDSYYTPIHEAIERLDMELVNLLREAGATFEQKDLQFFLAQAAKGEKFDLVDELLLKGARIQQSTYFGTSFVNPRAIPELVKRDFNFNLSYGMGVNFFSLAARFGHLEALQTFVKYGRKNTLETDFINTLSDALVSAAGRGHETVVLYLLGQGADINFISQNQTAFDRALREKHIRLANLIQSRGGLSASSLSPNTNDLSL